MRARIHDETAFLPNQSVDIGRIEPDLAGALEHRFAQRCRKALFDIDFAAGPVAGVNAAVPDRPFAGQLRRCQQLPIAQATAAVQADAVVPFTHSVAAQPDRNGVQGPLQARVLSGRIAFGRRQSTRARGQSDALAQFLQSQLLIEAAHRSDGLQQHQGLRALRRHAGCGTARRR